MVEAPGDLAPQVTTEDDRRFNCSRSECIDYCPPSGIGSLKILAHVKNLVIVLLLCLPMYAADKNWNAGTMLSYDQQTFSTYAQTNGTGHETPHTTYRVQIDGGDRIYFAERTLNWRWQSFPKVTENGPISWVFKGNDEMILKDDKGKEFTLTVTKTRIKVKPEVPAAATQ
jgi:hypothetical protein